MVGFTPFRVPVGRGHKQFRPLKEEWNGDGRRALHTLASFQTHSKKARSTVTDQVAGEARPAVNEAAVRVRYALSLLMRLGAPEASRVGVYLGDLDAALATERRNTVERVWAILHEHEWLAMPLGHDDWRENESAFDHIRRHFDEVAS